MSGLLLSRVGASLAVAGMAAGLTWAATDGGGSLITTAGPAAWVDDPLGGSVLPSDVGRLTVVAHATDPDGIVTVVLSVDGAETDTAEASGDDLVKVDLGWSPPGPGTYELAVVGLDPSGAATPPGTAVVQVGSDEEQPATTTTLPDETTLPDGTTSSTDELALNTTTSSSPGNSTSTSGPTTSATASTTSTTRPTTSTTRPTSTSTTAPPTTTTTTAPPCSPNTPVNTYPADGASVGSRTPTLQWDYRGCTAELFRIVVTPSRELAPVEAGGTVLGTDRQWTAPTLSCGTHWFHVRAEAGPNVGAWSSATSFTVFARVC